jgi:hypothetical protein
VPRRTRSTPDPARDPWDRRSGEPSRAYETFRRFRDLGPLRRLDALVDPAHEITAVTLRTWQARHDWLDRAAAWDDEVHRAADAARIEAIRDMHTRHTEAGRTLQAIALRVLEVYTEPEDVRPADAARLMDLGVRIERDTLLHSVEELQGVAPATTDPWEAISRELDAVPDTALGHAPPA